MKLYKYTDITEYAIKNLSNNQFYYNSVKNVNDPFEFNVKVNINDRYFKSIIDNLMSGNIDKAYHEVNDKDIEELVDFFNVLRDAHQNDEGMMEHIFKNWFLNLYGITCFTTTNQSIQMWGHYANSFKGICLEYDIEEKFYDRLIKVQYEEQPLAININPDIAGSQRVPCVQDIKDFFSFKHVDWAYEKEYRIINGSGMLDTYAIDSLKAIYFGVNCSKDQMIEIYNILKEHKHIKYYLMIVSQNSYDISYERINWNDLKRNISSK